MSKKASFPRPATKIVSLYPSKRWPRHTFVDFAINVGEVYRQLSPLPRNGSVPLRLDRSEDVEDETYYHIVKQGGIDRGDAIYFGFQTLN